MDTMPLPKGWTMQVRSSLFHAIALANAALKLAHARAGVTDLRCDLERTQSEVARLQEELSLKDECFGRLSPRRRPHYSPTQRLRILQLKAARGWSCEQAADALLVDCETMKSWLRRVDDEAALVRTSEPVNRFPDYVRYLVRQLKLLCPSMGEVRIAQVLALAGLALGPSTVRRGEPPGRHRPWL